MKFKKTLCSSLLVATMVLSYALSADAAPSPYAARNNHTVGNATVTQAKASVSFRHVDQSGSNPFSTPTQQLAPGRLSQSDIAGFAKSSSVHQYIGSTPSELYLEPGKNYIITLRYNRRK